MCSTLCSQTTVSLSLSVQMSQDLLLLSARCLSQNSWLELEFEPTTPHTNQSLFYFMSVHSKLILELHPVFPNYTLFIYLSFPSVVLQTPDHATYSVGLWLFVTGFCCTEWSKTSTSPPKMTHAAECLSSIVVGPLHRPPPTWDASSPGVVGHSGRQWRAARCRLGWWSRLPSSGRWAVRCTCSRGWGFQILGGAGRLLGKTQRTWGHTCLTLVQSEFYL